MDFFPLLQPLRSYYDSGATRSYDLRKEQLLKLRQALIARNGDIEQALYADLHKSPVEVLGSETSLVMNEINLMLRNLKEWMQPQNVPTNTLNLPSRSRIYKDPLGVVCIIGPWNYPLQLMLLPLAGAIAGGNCVLLKPSELAPATAELIASLVNETFDQNYIRVLTGPGEELIPPMIQAFRFDHIFYTGSVEVGRSIYKLAAEHLIPVTLELGGKSPAVVESDARLDVAVRRIALAKFLNAGQTCIAPDYVLIHETLKDAFLKKMIQTLRAFYGSAPESSYDYGRLINRKRFDTVKAYLAEGVIEFGGETNEADLYISPTLLSAVSPESRVMREEIFGPVLPILTYRSMQEALDIISKNPDPLAFYLFTEDVELRKQWIGQVRFGGGCINNAAWQFSNPNLPFGGVGNSGIGNYHGQYSFNRFTREKPVMETPTWIDPSIRYPPFRKKIRWLKTLMKMGD